jgi:hypothetical protein
MEKDGAYKTNKKKQKKTKKDFKNRKFTSLVDWQRTRVLPQISILVFSYIKQNIFEKPLK